MEVSGSLERLHNQTNGQERVTRKLLGSVGRGMTISVLPRWRLVWFSKTSMNLSLQYLRDKLGWDASEFCTIRGTVLFTYKQFPRIPYREMFGSMEFLASN